MRQLRKAGVLAGVLGAGLASQPLQGQENALFWAGAEGGKAPPTSSSVKAADGAARPVVPPKDVKIIFTFNNTEWEQVLEWFAKELGRTLNYTGGKPTGPFNYTDSIPHSLPDAMDIINEALIIKGYLVRQRYNFLEVLEMKPGGPSPDKVEKIELTELPYRGKSELVRVLLPLNHLVAKSLADEYKEIVGPFGMVTALPSSNKLLVAGLAVNVRQIVALIKESDGPQGEQPDFKAFKLKHISAVDAERVVLPLLGLEPRKNEPRDAAAAPNGGGGGGRRGGFMNPFQMMQQGMPSGAPAAPPTEASKTFVAIDDKSNTLFVYATPDKITRVEKTITMLDVEGAENNGDARQAPSFEAYPVEAGTAAGIATAIGSMFDKGADTRVASHPEGTHVLVYATPREHLKIKEILKKLTSEGKKMVAIPLSSSSDSVVIAEMLRKLLGLTDGEEKSSSGSNRRMWMFGYDEPKEEKKKPPGPQIVAESNTNKLLVYGTEPQIQLVRELLAQLGENTLAGNGLDQGKFRFIQLQNQDPRAVAGRAEEIWNQTGRRNPLKIEVLGEGKGPAKQIPRRPSESTPPMRGSNGDDVVQPPVARKRFSTTTLESPRPPAAGNPAQPGGEPSKEVTVILGPESIMVYSEDPSALAAAEQLMKMLVRPTGQGNPSAPTKISLKAADAKELAYVIDELLYGKEATPSFFGGDEKKKDTALHARIVADSRTNSLLVLGPQSEQRKVIELAKQLDEETPDTDLESQPKQFFLKYGGAHRIADQLKEVFAPTVYVAQGQNQQQPQDQGGGGFDPFGFGGGGRNRNSNRSRSNTAQSTKGKITISVDDPSNSILVAAPRPLMDTIEKTIKSLDTAAKDVSQSAQVVSLRNTRPETIQKALHALLGVKISQPANQPNQQNQNANQQNPNGMMPGGPFGPGGGRGRNGGGNGGNGGGNN